MKPSITDWIQAIAVVIGVAFALQEFVLHDRAQDRLEKETVMQLIISGQDESVSNSARELQQELTKLMQSESPTKADWGNLQMIYFPMQSHLTAWGFCYHNGMCDQELTEAYICKSLVDFDAFREMVNQNAGNPDFTREEGYAALLSTCVSNND